MISLDILSEDKQRTVKMYINNEPDWAKVIKEKRIFIFCGGNEGRKLFEKIIAHGCDVYGIIDNSDNVVKKFKSGQGWFDKAFTPELYLEQRQPNDIIIISSFYDEVIRQLLDMNIYSFLTPDKIDFSRVGELHYDDDYFGWQIKWAEIDSQIDAPFFQKYITSSDCVIEFGCGGGLLLRRLKCAQKAGVEINPAASEYANNNGIKTFCSLDEIDDASIDIIISSHALEHCLAPFEIVSKTYNKLKKHGRAIFVVPYEPLDFGFHFNDESQHLYIWNERTIGNLFRTAGFFVRETGQREVAWPDRFMDMYSNETSDWFNAVSVLESFRTGYYSVYIVAEKD